MKKIIIAALAAAMTLVFVIYCAAAGGEITVGGASAKAGETVELTVSIKNNPGFCYLRARPEYDENALELVSAKAGEVYADTIGLGLNVSVENGSDMHGDGPILVLTFRVKDNAQSGRYEVNLKFIECYNYDEEDVPVTITGGYIDVGGGAQSDPAHTGAGETKAEGNTGTEAQPGKTEDGGSGKPAENKKPLITAVICVSVCAVAAAVTAAVIAAKKKKK